MAVNLKTKVSSFFIVFTLISLIFSITTKAQSKSGETKQTTAPQAVFTNSTAITINDASTATPYPSDITVSGIAGNIPATPGGIKVTINGFSHTFSDDVAIALVGPTGAAMLIQDGAGDDPDMVNVTYTLSDDGATVLPNATAWPAGTYKPTSYYAGDSFPAPGPGTSYSLPGPVTGGTATFASIFGGTNPNGVWHLYVVDLVGGDSGNISGGWSLEIAGAAAPTGDAPVDLNGDGKTDYAVTRNLGGTPGSQVRWFYNINPTGSTVALDWGVLGDVFLTEDFDGDAKDDISVWRAEAGTASAFYILQSSTNTARVDNFGVIGDNPTVVGDYDGDGKSDPAVYRAGPTTGAQSTWFYRGSLTPGVISYIPWGINGDRPAPGDYNGDGKNDFVVARNDGASFRFWELLSGGTTVQQVFGSTSDSIVPGDYDGDTKTDLAVVRNQGGTLNWYYLPSSGGAFQQIVFGASTDIIAQGDYDGDGKIDAGIFRNGTFWSRNSGNGASQSFQLGSTNDQPVAKYNSH
jgi:subtilisin-like proprotein convertase family protein